MRTLVKAIAAIAVLALTPAAVLAQGYRDVVVIPPSKYARENPPPPPPSPAEKEQALKTASQEHLFWASFWCNGDVAGSAKINYQWIDPRGQQYSRYRWRNFDAKIITYIGDNVKFQNVFGVWIRHQYECDFDTVNKLVVGLRISEGRLRD